MGLKYIKDFKLFESDAFSRVGGKLWVDDNYGDDEGDDYDEDGISNAPKWWEESDDDGDDDWWKK